MKKTKIICTIGPATESEQMIGALMKRGMDITRLNFSHGTHEEHGKLIKKIRSVSTKMKKPVGIIVDLQGPKIRLGEIEKPIDLKRGQNIILTTGKKTKNKIDVTYKYLNRDVKRGHRILINDGLSELKVERVKGKDIFCKVLVGGKISSHKGTNYPDSKISLSSLTSKDIKDLYFAMSKGVDYVAISFVRSSKDIKKLKYLINKNFKKLKTNKPKIIAKIEKPEALENFVSILNEADAIMVARGDLGIEIPAEDVPLRQKEIIMLARQASKPVIVATQMLDSMIRNPRPTRAEVSDIANAVMDNVDGVMLSGETATGKYPKEATEMMNKIIMETEASPYDDVNIESAGGLTKFDAIGRSVCILVNEGKIREVVDLSSSELYRYVSKWRPEVDVFVGADEKDLYPNLFWGVLPFFIKNKNPKTIISNLKRKKILKGKKFILLIGEDKIEIID